MVNGFKEVQAGTKPRDHGYCQNKPNQYKLYIYKRVNRFLDSIARLDSVEASYYGPFLNV